MRTLVTILTLALSATSLAGGLELPESKLLPQRQLLLAQDQQEPSFTEVEDQLKLEGKKRKNAWKAAGLSLLLPGGGQYYVGSGLKTKIFAAAEVGLWSAFITFRHMGSWREDDFRLLAEAKAGANLDGKGDEFFDMIGFYGSREEYNKLGGVYGRDRQYYPDNDYYFWKWDSEASRLEFRDLKNDSRTYYRDADFTLGLIVANHVLSAIDAYFAAGRHNRQFDAGFSGIDVYLSNNGGFMLTLEARI